jgi:hypothetical protein
MPEKINIDPKNPNRATCRMFTTSGGRGFFAEVTVCVNTIEGAGKTDFSGNEFSWLRDVYGPDAWEWSICGELRDGVVFGVEWARNHTANQAVTVKADITIEHIGASPSDTNGDSCAYAACLATWAALGIEGSHHPLFKDGVIKFPK